MIHVYTPGQDRLIEGGPESLGEAALWIDLLEPNDEERAAVERFLSLVLPSRDAMQEIEASSRIYRQEGALFLTAPVLTASATLEPRNTAVTFIVTAKCVATLRYGTPQPFTVFAQRSTRERGYATTAENVVTGLLDELIGRLADVLEKVGAELDALSHQIFRAPELAPRKRRRPIGDDMQLVLRAIGRHGDLTSKVRDSLLGLDRLVGVLLAESAASKLDRQRLKSLARDIRSLSEHADYLSGKTTFLLDATLGVISIEQNNTIKIFSVVSVVFLPPTLIASIYGMNFDVMPELHFPGGYFMALGMMIMAAILPYLYFKRRGWL
ncbi:magnesium transporter CorA family protein [Telmatospirillum sp. J64-1]|uniref:magnesium transporter CorA family protein n=1 Tax=Telmatospirillum sp. J64-1 TaxID=2502183 RepID=UPI00115D002A|nr:magnesium transporter CorA family protein [Telmatospirillum sp. J64-1]